MHSLATSLSKRGGVMSARFRSALERSHPCAIKNSVLWPPAKAFSHPRRDREDTTASVGQYRQGKVHVFLKPRPQVQPQLGATWSHPLPMFIFIFMVRLIANPRTNNPVP